MRGIIIGAALIAALLVGQSASAMVTTGERGQTLPTYEVTISTDAEAVWLYVEADGAYSEGYVTVDYDGVYTTTVNTENPDDLVVVVDAPEQGAVVTCIISQGGVPLYANTNADPEMGGLTPRAYCLHPDGLEH